MKLKNTFFILGGIFIIFIVFECHNLWINGSLIVATLTHNMSWYRGEETWITRYNEAIWLSQNQQYYQAKTLIAPLLNDINIPKRAEIVELYGDLIYSSSGTIEDTIRMYEHALSIDPNERIKTKISYIKQIQNSQTGSSKTEKNSTISGSINSGSLEIEAKKKELQKISTERAQSLGNTTLSASASRSSLERLIQSAHSDSVEVVQDW